MKIAQRFNAGWSGLKSPSPGGTKEIWIWELDFCRPSGTCLPARLHPALKRWAILGCPFGTNVCLNSRKALRLGRDRAARNAKGRQLLAQPFEGQSNHVAE